MRVTVAVPESLMAAASHVVIMLAITEGFAAYANATWQDAEGNRYAVSSGIWTETQINGVLNPQDYQPVIDQYLIDYPTLDMGLVAEAQAAFVLSDAAIAAAPDKITAIVGMDGLDALAAMGLTLIPVPEP